MFRRLGEVVCCRPVWPVGLWVLACAVLTVVGPTAEESRRREPSTFLPDDAPSSRAVALQREAFGHLASRSRVVIVLARPSGLNDEDLAYVGVLARRLVAEAPQPDGWRVVSWVQQPFLRSRLQSRDGQAALILVNLDANFVTRRATDQVARIGALIDEGRPAGLCCELTGTAAIGRDYALQTETALHRTTLVTVSAVLLILAFVYRAPLAALVPLVSIGVSVYVSFRVLELLTGVGWGFSNAERIFTVVLVFGAGTDYALFWISRFREGLAEGRSRAEAARSSLTTVAPAILASAGTTIAGLYVLVLAHLSPYSNAGRALAVALTISLLAALTLAPALAVLMGGALFWPVRSAGRHVARQEKRWRRVSQLVIRRPGRVLLGGLACLGLPMLATLDIEFRYDTLGEIPEESGSARGLALAKRHFPQGELFSFDVLIEWPGWADADTDAVKLSGELAREIAQANEVADVWTLSQPFGTARAKGAGVLDRLISKQAEPYYLAKERCTMRAEVMLRSPPLSRGSMGAVKGLLDGVEAWARVRLGPDARVIAAGPTPYILDVADIAAADRRIVMPLVVVVIWVIVMVLLRDAMLSAFMLGATLVTYAATIGLTHLFFVYVLGEGGLDYKVDLFLFVLIVAVGQDYNIFLVTRLRQETATASLRDGTARAILRTGAVISNCGLIMAATLGSLGVTGLDLLEQLGFALSVGVLIDTFVVRPLLVPSFFLIRQGRKPEPPANAQLAQAAQTARSEGDFPRG